MKQKNNKFTAVLKRIYKKLKKQKTSTLKNRCRKSAKKTISEVVKARKNPNIEVVGSRNITKKQQKVLIDDYVKSCIDKCKNTKPISLSTGETYSFDDYCKSLPN